MSFYDVTKKLQQTKKFIKELYLLMISPLFPQERAIRHLIERFIASPRVIIYFVNNYHIRPKINNMFKAMKILPSFLYPIFLKYLLIVLLYMEISDIQLLLVQFLLILVILNFALI